MNVTRPLNLRKNAICFYRCIRTFAIHENLFKRQRSVFENEIGVFVDGTSYFRQNKLKMKLIMLLIFYDHMYIQTDQKRFWEILKSSTFLLFYVRILNYVFVGVNRYIVFRVFTDKFLFL